MATTEQAKEGARHCTTCTPPCQLDDAAVEASADGPDRCPCDRAFHLEREHHDWLVGFEERGVPGAVEMIHYLDGAADDDNILGRLPGSTSSCSLPCTTGSTPLMLPTSPPS